MAPYSKCQMMHFINDGGFFKHISFRVYFLYLESLTLLVSGDDDTPKL